MAFFNQTNHLSKQSGFTLMELMIVVAIVAILSAIALPSYNRYVMKAHRTDAQAAMVTLAQYMESQYNRTFAYPEVGTIPDGLKNPTNVTPYYTFAVDTGTGQSFTITATKTAIQNDTECSPMTLNEKGAKGAKGLTGAAMNSECWK